MHGFNQGRSVLDSFCLGEQYDVLFIQEHWLTPDKMNKILSFSDNYTGFGISAMEDKVKSGIFQGRPFSGTSVLINNKLIKFVKNVICRDRFVIFCLNDIAFVNMYLPCKSNTKTDEYLNVLIDTLDQISGHLTSISPKFIIAGGDVNTDLRCTSVSTDTIISFANELNLVECSNIVRPVNIDYTFHSLGLGHRTWIDFFLVSSDLTVNIADLNILELALNISDHLPIVLKIKIQINEIIANNLCNNSNRPKPSVKYRWDRANVNDYYEQTRLNTQTILDEFRPIYNKIINHHNISSLNNVCRSKHVSSLTVTDYSVTNSICTYLIDKYYSMTVDALIDACRCTIPAIKANTLKHWWSDELNQLKQKSIDSHHIWVNANKPRSGNIFDMYKNDKYAYKLCIKKSKTDNELSISNELHDALCSKSNGQFWNIWNSKFNSNKKVKPKLISGLIDSNQIAEGFSKYFGSICKPNSQAYNELKCDEFNSKFDHYFGDFLNLDDLFSVELISTVICELKTGRAPGLDGLTTEHLLYCHPSIHLMITYLCNLVLLSGHVPSQFGIGLTFPIEKGRLGNKTVTFDDYRGITISPLISKILEKCILLNFQKYFRSSDNQFGFKKKVGCEHAIYSLRSTIDYFVNNNSTVNLCSLDVAKAFDRVNHYTLFIKLMNKHVPVNIIMLLVNWYRNSSATVNWNGTFSSSYRLLAGVRQGGAFSPVLFATYVDCLIQTIAKHGYGCHIGLQSMAIFMYADDLILLSGSVSDLQAMINVCLKEFDNLDLSINVKKSICMRIGRHYKAACNNISILGSPVPWATHFTYLGVTIKSSVKFLIDFKPSRANFYRAFNSLYSKICKANEFLIVSLVKTFCIPLIMFSVGSIILNASSLKSMDSLMYNAFGKIFKTFDHSILDNCMFYMNYWPPRYEYYNRRINFLKHLNKIENNILHTWFGVSGNNELSNLYNIFKLNTLDSPYAVKQCIWNKFVNSID